MFCLAWCRAFCCDCKAGRAAWFCDTSVESWVRRVVERAWSRASLSGLRGTCGTGIEALGLA